jgi:hypothetical protein
MAIQVERTVMYIPSQKVYSVSIESVEPYGKHYPKRIYISAVFHKDREKAKEKAWGVFMQKVKYQDEQDTMYDGMKREILEVRITYASLQNKKP